MSAIVVNATNFRGAYARLNGHHRIKVTYRSFLRAALTVGFQSWSHLFESGWPVWLVQLCFGLSGRGTLKSECGDLKLRSLNNLLDPSDRSQLTYKQGMVFTKLVAEELLDVPWLANVDELKRQRVVQTKNGTDERGDLVGRGNNGSWHVLEAKGRTSRFDANLIQKAKRQAANITHVQGRPPDTTSACISCLWEVPIRVLLDDPEPEPEGAAHAHRLKFDESRLWEQYYGALAAYVLMIHDSADLSDPSKYLYAPLPPMLSTSTKDIAPSMSKDEITIAKQHRQLEIGLPAGVLANSSSRPDPSWFGTADGDFVGKDGIILRGDLPNWDEES